MVVFAVVPAIFSTYFMLLAKSHEAMLMGAAGFLLFFTLASFTMAFALTPTTFIALLSGYFFNWWGLTGVAVSYLVATVIGLLFGRKLNEWFVGGFLSEDEQLSKFFKQMKEKSLLMVIFGRLSPVLPFAMMNIAFASIRVSWGSYLFGSLIGMFPRTFVFFYTGMNAPEIWSFLMKPSLEGLSAVVPVLLVIISTAGILWLVNRSWKKSHGLP